MPKNKGPKPFLIKINPEDNVKIVVNKDGLKAGTEITDGFRVKEDIPQGHKIALNNIKKGEKIIKYGKVIGYARNDIEQGCWINEDKVILPEMPAIENLRYESNLSNRPVTMSSAKTYHFSGYKDKRGKVGTKNLLGIVACVQCGEGVLNKAVARIREDLLPQYPHVDGTTPIIDVLAPGEKVEKKGLVFAATPASDFVCGTLQLAAGINLQVFTTGRGTPYGLKMAPVIKVSSRTELQQKWDDLIDINAGKIAAGKATYQKVGEEIFALILKVASGEKQTRADYWGIENRLCLFNPTAIT